MTPPESHGDSTGESSGETTKSSPRSLSGRVPGIGKGYGRFAGIGLHFAVTILVFAYGGYRLDLWLDTSPWFLLVGVFVGFLGGFLSMIKKVNQATAPRSEKGSASGSDPIDGDSPR